MRQDGPRRDNSQRTAHGPRAPSPSTSASRPWRRTSRVYRNLEIGSTQLNGLLGAPRCMATPPNCCPKHTRSRLAFVELSSVGGKSPAGADERSCLRSSSHEMMRPVHETATRARAPHRAHHVIGPRSSTQTDRPPHETTRGLATRVAQLSRGGGQEPECGKGGIPGAPSAPSAPSAPAETRARGALPLHPPRSGLDAWRNPSLA